MDNFLRDLVDKNKHGAPVGICSVCSANPYVLEAALEFAAEQNSHALIESTSNQVNQYGGYTGMKPKCFNSSVRRRAKRIGLPLERVILGGDHLGPYPWRNENASSSMDKACIMVRDYIKAGFSKIHLDASIPLGKDPKENILAAEIVAERSAELCKVAEVTRDENRKAPVYIIGTDVPLPGGSKSDQTSPPVTEVSELEKTISLTKSAFTEKGLESAWSRVIAIVVQSGVEFSSETIYQYDRDKTRTLCSALNRYPNLVFESHSTDYQQASHLHQMVEDGFAILKVGPALTFAFREAIFLLSHIEEELFSNDYRVEPAKVPQILDQVMRLDPRYWESYYWGNDRNVQLARKYSLSDRCRYYWSKPIVQDAVQNLLLNLSYSPIPLSLISQFFPFQFCRIREGMLNRDPLSLIKDKIKDTLRMYPSESDEQD